MGNKMEVKDTLTPGTYWASYAYPDTCTCIDCDFPGQSVGNVIICLDNTPPKGQITIDLLSDNDFITSSVPTTPAAECGDMAIGKYIIGRFSVTDDSLTAVPNEPHVLRFGLSLLPFPSSFLHVPSSTEWPSVPTSGIPLPPPPSPSFPRPLPSGIWQLHTAGFRKCGYVINLSGADRTNWNSQGYKAISLANIGFCLIEPT